MEAVVDNVQIYKLSAVTTPGTPILPTSAKTATPIYVGLQVTNTGTSPVQIWVGLFNTAPAVGSTVDLSTAVASSVSASTIPVGSVYDLTATANQLFYGNMPASNLTFYIVSGHIGPATLFSDSFPGTSLNAAWVIQAPLSGDYSTVASGDTASVSNNAVTLNVSSTSGTWHGVEIQRPISINNSQDFTMTVNANFSSALGNLDYFILSLRDSSGNQNVGIYLYQSSTSSPITVYVSFVGNAAQLSNTFSGNSLNGPITIQRRSGITNFIINGVTYATRNPDVQAYSFVALECMAYDGYSRVPVSFSNASMTSP